jgi:hypothetical protein
MMHGLTNFNATKFGTWFHISYKFYFMLLSIFRLTLFPDQVPLSHTSAEAIIALHYNTFLVSSIRDLFYIYTNFFRWTHGTWFLTFTKLLTITAVKYIVAFSRTWYARLLFLVFFRAVTQKQGTSNQMKARSTYCNFGEMSVPYPHPVPCEL